MYQVTYSVFLTNDFNDALLYQLLCVFAYMGGGVKQWNGKERRETDVTRNNVNTRIRRQFDALNKQQTQKVDCK